MTAKRRKRAAERVDTGDTTFRRAFAKTKRKYGETFRQLAEHDREQDARRAIDAYDLLRGRVGDALAVASALDDVVDAIPAVADKDQSRRLAGLIYFAGELRELLDEIVSEGEATAAVLIRGSEDKKSRWPRDRPIPSFSSVEEEDAFWRAHEFELTDADFSTDHGRPPRIVSRTARPPTFRGPSPRVDIDLTGEQIREIEAKARRNLQRARRSKSKSSRRSSRVDKPRSRR